MSDQAEVQKAPFALEWPEGVLYRAVDLVNEMTVRQTEQLSKVIGTAFPMLVELAGKDDTDPMQFAELIFTLLDSGKVREVLALLITRADGTKSTDDERREAAGEMPNGKAVELVQGFFGSIGK